MSNQRNDYSGSYEELFHQIVRSHKESLDVLFDVHLLPRSRYVAAMYQSGDEAILSYLKDVGLGQWKPIGRDLGSTDYGQKGQSVGVILTAYDETGALRCLVVLSDDRDESYSDEARFASVIVPLLHELGHAYDIQNKIFLHPENERVDIIEVEVFANLYALTHLEKIGCATLLEWNDILLGAVESGSVDGREIVRRVREAAQNSSEKLLEDCKMAVDRIPIGI